MWFIIFLKLLFLFLAFHRKKTRFKKERKDIFFKKKQWIRNLTRDRMFQTTTLNYDYTRWVKRPLTSVFFSCSLEWKVCMAPSTSLSELWSLEIGIIKAANVTQGLRDVLVGLPAYKCPFITRLVKISRGSMICTFPHYCRRPLLLPLYSPWVHGNFTPIKSSQNGQTGGPWQSR